MKIKLKLPKTHLLPHVCHASNDANGHNSDDDVEYIPNQYNLTFFFNRI